jgi:hypothetical protein
MAEAPVAGNPQAPAATLAGAAPATAEVAGFLATLSVDPSGGRSAAELLLPRPVFLSGCTSNSQCPKGQLCCLACGFSDCEAKACFQPVRGGCPPFQ